MLSIRAIYDGKSLKLLDKVDINEPKEVIITFLEPTDKDISTQEDIHVAEKGRAFDFLNNEAEEIYSDDDLKVKYK